MQALADDPRDKTSGSAYKAAAKEKFTRFYDLFEEVGERHRMARVLEEDAGERSAVGEEVVKLIVPSLQQFMQKQKEKEFSKSEYRVFILWNELTPTVDFTRSSEV
jgi:exocyst complex protein 7